MVVLEVELTEAGKGRSCRFHPTAHRGLPGAPGVVQHLVGKLLSQRVGLVVVPQVGTYVGPRGEEVAAPVAVAGDGLAQRPVEGLEGVAAGAPAHRDLFLLAEYEVGHAVAARVDKLFGHGLVAGRYKGVSGPHNRAAVQVGVVEGVACDDLCLVVGAAGTEARVVIVAPGDMAAELVLLAYVVDVAEVGHPEVFAGVEACRDGVDFEAVGAADAVESVNYQHDPLLVGGTAERQRLGGEALAAPVHGGDAEAVDRVGSYGQRAGGIAYQGAGIESPVAHPGVDDVAVGGGGRLERVGHGTPGEAYLVRPRKLGAQVAHRQGLHGVVVAVLCGDEFQDAFIDGPGYDEAEARVEAVAHVGKVLVREQLEQHGGYLGHAGLEVRLVPHTPAAPLGFVGAAYVVGHLRKHGIGEVARYLSRHVVDVDFALFAGEVDAQTADNRVVEGGTGIGVEGKGQVYRHVQARAVGQYRRASGQVVDPLSPAFVVVDIVVFALGGRVDRRRESGPLQPVAGRLGEAGVSAGLGGIVDGGQGGVALDARGAHPAGHVAVATAYLHGIGRDRASLFTGQVAQLDAGLPAPFEVEVPQIDPGAAAHRLVDVELRFTSLVIYGIEGVVGAVLDGLISHVDGISPPFGNRGVPAGPYLLVRVGGGVGLAEAPVGKGVLEIGVNLLPVGESDAALLPAGFPGRGFAIGGRIVVVGYEFVQVGVALAG